MLPCSGDPRSRIIVRNVNPNPADLSTDEAALIARAQGGDLNAFNILVERYQTAVYNICLRMLGAPQPAEDATQEAFINAYRRLETFRGGVFRSWLFRIAANACYDEMRRRKTRTAVSLDEPHGEDERHYDLPDPGPTMEQHAEQAELRGALESALKRLPEDQRMAIVLVDVQGLDYAEVAVVMNCSLGTIKSRINRGRARLRAYLLERSELLPSRFRPTGENK